MTRRVETPLSKPLSIRKLVLFGWGLMALTYFLIFRNFSESDYLLAAQRALINVVPAALLSLAVLWVIERGVMGRRPIWQLLSHIGLAIVFSLLWYIGVQIGYGLQGDWINEGIIGRPLSSIALTWQMFQGVTLYTAIAATVYAVVFYRENLSLKARLQGLQAAPRDQSTKRILVKDGKAMRPVNIERILSISGAGDYAEIITRDGEFLSGTSLSEFEQELPEALFLRVHRSHIVNVDAVISVEPAGNGKLSLFFPKGHTVTTSRAGAKRIKEHSV